MKTKLGIVITQASGKLGGSILQGQGSNSIMRSHFVPRKSASNNQVLQRSFYKQVVSFWGQLSENDRLSWLNASESRINGFHLFLSKNIKRLALGYFIAQNYTDSFHYDFPSSWSQGNWAQSLGTAHVLLQAANGDVVAVGGSGYLAMSCTDGTDNWIVRTSSYSSYSMYTAVLSSSNSILIGGSYPNSILKSITNGVTWTVVTLPFSMSTIYSIIRSASGSLLICGLSNNHIYESLDDGVSWNIWSTVASYTGIYYLRYLSDGSYLIAPYGAKHILRSTNNGSSWSIVLNVANSGSFFNLLNVYKNYITAQESTTNLVWSSNDFGKTFSPINLAISPSYLNIRQVNQSGIMIARYVATNFIFYSYDLGFTWHPAFKPTYQTYPNCALVTKSGNLYIGGYSYARPIRAKLF